MKTSFFVLFFCFISLKAQWVKIENPSEITKINDIQIVNQTKIFATATKGGGDYKLYSYFIRKESLKENWQTIKLPDYVYDIRKIDFVDSLNGYAITQLRDNTNQSVIMKTDSGGKRWRRCFTTPNTLSIILKDIKYINNKVCMAVGFAYGADKSFLVLSEDGGWGWQIIEYPRSYLHMITLVNDSSCYISGNGVYSKDTLTFGKIFFTTDFGKTSIKISTPQPQDQNSNYCMSFLKKYDDDIFIGGIAYMMDSWEPLLYKSNNEGFLWESFNFPFNYGIVSDFEKDFVENKYYFACGNDIYMTDMEITNWKITKLVNSNDNVSDICISDSIKIARSLYNIFVYDSTVTVGIVSKPTENLIFELSQNYPNPFNPTTKIKYSIPSNMQGNTTNVKLVVYDLLGKEVVTLVNKAQFSGSYEVEFKTNNLSSGVYFYRLQAGGFVESKKMILMR